MMVQKELKQVKHKRRYCRMPDCNKIVKSQGLCQRHGAKTRKCKIPGCDKQAQGNFDKMCKAHFKQTKTQLIPKPLKPEERMSLAEPAGETIFKSIVPASIGWCPRGEGDLMPLVAHLKEGFEAGKPRGWHRNEERRARGLAPVENAAIQLEGWERQLVWMEICMLSGCSQASFRHLARAWGRDKGFHTVLSQFICERQGSVERKIRIKGQAGSKKPKRSPMSMDPGSSDLNAQQAMELDQCDLDILLEMNNTDSFIPIDPTVNYQGPPEPTNPSPGKRGKRRPLEMCQVIEPEGNYPAPAPFHLGQQIMPPPHVIPFHGPRGVQHAVPHGMGHAAQLPLARIGQVPGQLGLGMGHGGKMITHEALILEENSLPPQPVQTT